MRYIDADKFKSHLEKAMKKMHLIGGVKGVDVGAVIAALDRQPTVDVVPRAELAREIFGDVKKAIKEEVRDYCRGFESMETPEMQEYYKTKQNTAIYLYMKIDHIEKKYTEENKDENQN